MGINGGIMVKPIFTEIDLIFKRTKKALADFIAILTPIIENSTDDHERLYWHHIYEEEEHRSDRLDLLMPKIQEGLKDDANFFSNQLEFIHLLQDISLEKFGLHNFLEHLDLFLFPFKGTELEEKIQELRNLTFEDYQKMKEIMEKLNQEFPGGNTFHTSVPTDEKEQNNNHVKMDMYSQKQVPLKPRKSLTVGSLKKDR